MTEHKRFGKRARGMYRLLIVLCALVLILAVIALYFISEKESISDNPAPNTESYSEVPATDSDRVEEGIHLRTGLVAAEGFREVINNCTGCHSAKIVIQNRMDAKGWQATIRWMQDTQNLWDLGKKESVIIKYLVTNYPVQKKGRREPLKEVEWYRLEERP